MDRLPTNAKQWEDRAQSNGVYAAKITDVTNWSSASKFDERLFLALRAVWTIKLQSLFKPRDWGINNIPAARELLQRLPGWRDFLINIRSQISPLPTPNLSTFSIVWYYQRWVTKIQGEEAVPKILFSPLAKQTRSQTRREERDPYSTPTRTSSIADSSITEKLSYLQIGEDDSIVDPSLATPESAHVLSPQSPAAAEAEGTLYPAVYDEQIVNACLIIFLNAISIHLKGMLLEWSLQRKSFRLSSGDSDILFQAMTDGHLANFAQQESQSRAIVEVKPFVRSRDITIRYQETAQMAAWIYAEPDEESATVYHRLLVSQDRHEIYLTIAEYDDSYVEYLRGSSKRGKPSLMIMHEFGPWSVDVSEHMEMIGEVLLAFMLQGGKLDMSSTGK